MPYYRIDYRDQNNNPGVEFLSASGVPQVLAEMKRRGIPKKPRKGKPAQVLLVWEQVKNLDTVKPEEEEFM